MKKKKVLFNHVAFDSWSNLRTAVVTKLTTRWWYMTGFYVCSIPEDFGADGGGHRAVWLHSCVSCAGLPAARCPVAQHSWTTGGGASSPGSRVQLSHSEPADKCGTRSTVHLQYFQPTGPRPVNPVHGGLPVPAIWTWGATFCVAGFYCVSGGQSPPPGGNIGAEMSGSSAENPQLLQRGSCQMILMFINIKQSIRPWDINIKCTLNHFYEPNQ